MAEPTLLTSIDFLPDNLKKNDLYRELAQGIDLALTPGPQAVSEPLDEVLAKLRLDYADQEAVTAYYNHFVKPVIGTRSALEFAFNLLNVQTTLVEWFDFIIPTSPFKFQLTFDVFPGTLDFDALIKVIFALKNERSFLSAIRMVDCADTMILDYGYLDIDYLSATEGYIDPGTGVLICLYQERVIPISTSPSEAQALTTHIYTQYHLNTGYPLLDNYDISLPWNSSYNNIVGIYGSISGFSVPYLLGDEVCALVEDLNTHGYCTVSLINRSAYRTATFQNQIVPSESETLSGGMGFAGELEEFVDDTPTGVTTLDGSYLLSGVTSTRTPYIQSFWITHPLQVLTETTSQPIILGTAQHIYAQVFAFTQPQFTLSSDALSVGVLADTLLHRWNTSISGYAVRARNTFEVSLREWLLNPHLYPTLPSEWWSIALPAFQHILTYPGVNPSTLSLELILSELYPSTPSLILTFLDEVPEVSLTTTERYHTGTYENQLVPSSEGALSDGLGFPGLFDRTTADDTAALLDDSIELEYSPEPYLQASWDSRTRQAIANLWPPQSKTAQTVYYSSYLLYETDTFTLDYQLSSDFRPLQFLHIVATGLATTSVRAYASFEFSLRDWLLDASLASDLAIRSEWQNLRASYASREEYSGTALTTLSYSLILSAPAETTPQVITSFQTPIPDVTFTRTAVYHSNTFESQLLPSEDGTLSGGLGFPGEYEDIEFDPTSTAYTLYSLSDNYVLSETLQIRIPYYRSVWTTQTRQQFDNSLRPEDLRAWATHQYWYSINVSIPFFALGYDTTDTPPDISTYWVPAHIGESFQGIRAWSAFEYPLDTPALRPEISLTTIKPFIHVFYFAQYQHQYLLASLNTVLYFSGVRVLDATSVQQQTDEYQYRKTVTFTVYLDLAVALKTLATHLYEQQVQSAETRVAVLATHLYAQQFSSGLLTTVSFTTHFYAQQPLIVETLIDGGASLGVTTQDLLYTFDANFIRAGVLGQVGYVLEAATSSPSSLTTVEYDQLVEVNTLAEPFYWDNRSWSSERTWQGYVFPVVRSARYVEEVIA